jgi:hypothetical protein
LVRPRHRLGGNPIVYQSKTNVLDVWIVLRHLLLIVRTRHRHSRSSAIRIDPTLPPVAAVVLHDQILIASIFGRCTQYRGPKAVAAFQIEIDHNKLSRNDRRRTLNCLKASSSSLENRILSNIKLLTAWHVEMPASLGCWVRFIKIFKSNLSLQKVSFGGFFGNGD